MHSLKIITMKVVSLAWLLVALTCLCHSAGCQERARTRLVFEIDEGFQDSLIVRFKDNLPELDRRLGNIYRALSELTGRYDVSVLIYPTHLYDRAAWGNSSALPLNRVHPALRHTFEFFRRMQSRGGHVTIYLEAYSSGIATAQDGALGHCPPPSLTGRLGEAGRLGLSMDVDAISALKDAYPETFAGIRFHEVYGSDIVWKVTPVGGKHGFALDPEVVRACLETCRRKKLFLLWSDSTWLMKSPPTTGEPSYVYSDHFKPYYFSDPYRAMENEAEAKLGKNLCFLQANNNYHYTPNLEFLDSKIGPIAPGIARPLPSWLYFNQPFKQSPLKGRARAGWGMSIQSWFWHEMSYTLTGHYYRSGELACPVEILISYARKGLREGAAVLQFEPSWYFFNEAMPGKPDYRGTYEQAPDHSGRLALKSLKQALLNPNSPGSPPDRLDAVFDRNQQRFHENDSAHPPKNYAQSTLGLAWCKKGKRPTLEFADFYSYAPHRLQPGGDRFGTWVFGDAVKAVQRVELDGDGVDELLIVQQDSAGTRHVEFYNQNSGWMGEDAAIAGDNADGVFVSLTAANLIPEVIGQGDPDEIIAVRRARSGSKLNLRIYKLTWTADDQLSFRYTPLPDDQNRELIERYVDRASLDAATFIAVTGLRTDARLFADGKRSVDRLVVSVRDRDGVAATVTFGNRTTRTKLRQMPLTASGVMVCGIDVDFTGTDSLCAFWRDAAQGSRSRSSSKKLNVVLYHPKGDGFTSAEWPGTPPRNMPGMSAFVFALRKRILLNAVQPKPAALKDRIEMTKPEHARITKINGIGTLEVDGTPFLLLGAQCDVWRSTRQDKKTVEFFEGYREMNATTVSVGIPWAKMEREEDHYDFSFLDWFVQQAETRGLKLVVNLFNTNICGKVQEGAGTPDVLEYTPSYIIGAPEKYQRMVLPGPFQYDRSGPPMCPNDPHTLERERRLVVKVAKHLKSTDTLRTVIMLQIDNEFYYQQWVGEEPQDAKAVRCHCRFCEEKWKVGKWKNGEEFMFHSFADYVKSLTDAVEQVYPLPLYVNSPWWEPYVIPIFLDRCPNLSFVGIDGVYAPQEPNMLSRSQLGRNIPFAAENPTENPKTRINLDILPYYSLIGQEGIGNLLWECGPPHTVVEDPEARRKYAEALYPLKQAQVPIARARGTENLLGWYAIRDIATDVTTDVFGNFIPTKKEGSIVEKDQLFIREGTRTRTVSGGEFEASLGDLHFQVSGSSAGIIVRTGAKEVILAVPKGRITITGMHPIRAEEGRFERDKWKCDGPFAAHSEGGCVLLDIIPGKILRITW